MNKKGFTLVEITISIVLILALMLIVVPNLIDMGDGTKKKMYESKVNMALGKAYQYGVEHMDDLTSGCTDVTVGTLIDLGYMQGDEEGGYNLINPITGESMNNLILCVYYENSEVRTRVK